MSTFEPRECEPSGEKAPSSVWRILDDARTAPSAGNCQPWRWRVDGRHLTLSLRDVAGRSALNEDARLHLMALGTALETAVISASTFPVSLTIQAVRGASNIGGPVRAGGFPTSARSPCAVHRFPERRTDITMLRLLPRSVSPPDRTLRLPMAELVDGEFSGSIAG